MFRGHPAEVGGAQRQSPARPNLHAKAMKSLPSAPYRFPAATAVYQPQWVRIEAARRVIPRADGLRLLSLFGWTLGGLFVVEWTDSPIGPYREVAVLGGLVSGGGAIGAWASHIVVTSPAAVEAGRSIWGLPAVVGTIEFLEPSDGGEGGCTVDFVSDAHVVISGFPPSSSTDADLRVQGQRSQSFELPSLSGALPGPGSQKSALLRYPLSLSSPRSLRLRPPLDATLSDGVTDASLRRVLDGAPATPVSIEACGVDIVAGVPSLVSPGTPAANSPPPSLPSDAGGGSAGALSWPLMALDASALFIYTLLTAIGTMLTNGEYLQPPIVSSSDFFEIALALNTGAAHALAWLLAGALTGLTAVSWLQLDEDNHAASPVRVAGLLRTWLLSCPLYEGLHAAARLSLGMPTGMLVSPPAEMATEALGVLVIMALWRRFVIERLWWWR